MGTRTIEKSIKRDMIDNIDNISTENQPKTTRDNPTSQSGNNKLKSELWNFRIDNSKLKCKEREYDKVKSVIGEDKVKELIKIASQAKKKKRETQEL